MANTSQSNNVTSDVQALFPWTGETMQFAERAYRHWLRGAETVQSQAIELWNAELQKGIEAMTEMAKCQTAAEAFGVQTRYATEAMQGLFAGSQKVVEQLAAFTHTSWPAAALLSAEAGAEEATAEATARRSSRRRS